MKLFQLNEVLVTGTKIMDLVDPTKKMSKTEDNPKGVISLLDEPSVARKKIMSATTDSEMLVKYDEENKPGISNLLNIASVMSDKSIDEITEMFVGKNYGEFKKYVAEVVISKIEDIQTRYNEIINSDELDIILDKGKTKSTLLAKEKYELMCSKIGLTRF